MPAAMTQRGLKHQSERRQLKVSGGVPRGAGVRSLVLAMTHLELIASGPPSRPRNGTTSFTVTASLTRCLRVFSPSLDSEKSSFRPDGMVRTLCR